MKRNFPESNDPGEPPGKAIRSTEDSSVSSEVWAFEALYFSGDHYFAALLHAIASATSSVDLETYIFDDDVIGRQFAKALVEAAQRGLKVRLLVDGIGAASWADRYGTSLCRKGVEVRVYHPLRFTQTFTKILSELSFLRTTAIRSGSFFSHLNRRNHRKAAIIDGTSAWIGSLNISACHSEKALGVAAWRDTGISVGGKPLLYLKRGFDYAWVRSHTTDGKRRWTETLFPKIKSPKKSSSLVRLNYTIPLRRRNFRELSRIFKSATGRIWITNAYLAPSKPMIRRLQLAAERGIDVRILLPRTSDVFFMPWVAGAHYAQLLKSGVRIFEFLPRFIHAKSVIVDNWMTVGTSNLNRRSLLKDFEVDIVLTSTAAKHELEQQYLQDLSESQEVTSAPGAIMAFLGRFIISFMKDWI